MSKLEDRVKPIVEPLLLDETVTLDLAAQTTLAVWAVKNTIVFEAFRVDPPWFFTDSERRIFRDSLRPPARSNIWIAKCVGHTGAYCSAFDLGGVVEGTETRMRAHLTTMAFGPLAIQVVGGKLPDSVPLTTTVTVDQTPGPWEQVAVRIWPSPREVVNWPPPVHLRSELGLKALEDRWGPHSEPVR